MSDPTIVHPMQTQIDNDKFMTIAATLPVIGLVIFFAVKTLNPLQKFYAKQAVGLTILAIVQFILSFFEFIPYIGFLFGIVVALFSLTIFVLWIINLIKALQGEMFRTPVISDLLDQYIK